MPEQDVKTASEAQPPGSRSPAGLAALTPLQPLQQHLFLVASCDRPLDGGARHALASLDEVVLGRGDGRTASRQNVHGMRRLAVTLPGRQLSATHARLVRVSARWTVEDCHSTNGTFVNGERVERAVLADGDVLELGRTLLLYREALPTPRGTPADLDTKDFVSSVPGMATLVPSDASELAALASIASSTLPVLLLGESGTGKEVLAQAVHRLSGRPGSLVPVNCGAIPESLLEGQLFGHTRGAFSGAVRDEIGLVRASDRGTLFLDEIGDLPSTSQAALLRVLQEGEVQPVGSTRSLRVDIRVVAATHRPLARLAESGEFRSDLYARLNGYAHHLAPLRARIEDFPILLGALLRRVAPNEGEGVTLAPAAVRALLQHGWPLNVRELQQTLTRAVVLAKGERIEPLHLPSEMANVPRMRGPSPAAISEDERREDDLRRELGALLEKHEGNVSEVARSMGKARMQIQRWMKRFDLDPRRHRG
ncbi:MAG TPA: sigma 54-interacting transcriptional regulator [Polyangiaceae bacterium]|jgi:transcriptional regulator with GAF, ATPase, and Fis domain